MNDSAPVYTPPQEFQPPITPRRSLKFPMLIITIGFLVLCSTFTVAYAYGQINIGSKETQENISDVIQSLPFMPKTPRYVLKSSVGAHKKVTRFRLDASFGYYYAKPCRFLGYQ
jgi:hypothetical protein